jgi:peptidyl-prolyl cis-trans isomerase SurA
MSFISNIQSSYADNVTKLNKDQTVAVVNNEPIFMSEVNNIVNSLLSQPRKMLTSPVKHNELRNIVLNQQVEYLLLKQEAKKQKIQVTKQEIQLGINEIKKLFKSDQIFNNELKKQNISMNNFTKNVEDQIAIMKLLRKSLGAKIKMPSEVEVKAFYDKFLSNFKPVSQEHGTDVIAFVDRLRKKFNEHVKIRQIFIMCNKNASPAQIKAAQIKIANIKGALRKQQSFTSVSSHYSEKDNNINFGVIYKNDLPNNLNDIIFNLRVGEYTKEPIKTDSGYHFIKVEEKYAKKDMNYNGVKNDVKEFLYKKNFINVYMDYIKSLRNKAYVKINKMW